MVEFLVGVDGGGSGTRVKLARPNGFVLSQGAGGPSALGQGVNNAWMQVRNAIAAAFAGAGLPQPDWPQIALAAGLSGAHTKVLSDAFRAELPPFGKVLLETDGYTMLIGAHAGRPGVLVASGTGSVGEVLRTDRSHAVAGGWGFPVGDEGSGSWLGLHAVRAAQAAMDGRAAVGPLARKVWGFCGQTRQDLAAWCAKSAQFAYAQVAPLVFECEDCDPVAGRLLAQAAQDLESIADTLDPAGSLPVAVCGSIGARLQRRMCQELRDRCVEAVMGPADGALWLLQQSGEDRV
jgi:glucosamine kinase